MRKKKYKMRKIVLLLMVFTTALQAQEQGPEQQEALKKSREITWEANRELEEDQFVNAEAKYRRAISRSSENSVAPYNLGNALYDRESYTEAFGRFKQAGETAPDKSGKHSAFHNMGNVFMKNKEYEKAVEAYKEALRNNPTDEETRYNLALAKEMLKKQQNEDQKNEDQKNEDQKEENKDQKDEGDNEDENKDKQKQDQQKDQGDQGEEEKEENKQGQGDEQEQQPQSQEDGEAQPPRPNQLSPQQIQNLLEAMQNEERKVQEKLDAQKVKGVPTKSKKDW